MFPAIKDAIVFHSELNPKIWGDDSMLPEVREDLLKIMADFQDFLGVDDLNIVDITVSGSNAAYTYTQHSDIDLHLVVKLPGDLDAMYTELFDAKKTLYNLTRNIKVRGFDVELYVQNYEDPVKSLGIYSVLRDKWIDFPKRIKANIDDVSVMARVDIYTRRITEVLAGDDLVLAKTVWNDLKNMRKSGLERAGEFSPENLAYKILRTRGLAGGLYDHIIAIKDKQLSLEHIEERRLNEMFDRPAEMKVMTQVADKYVVETKIGTRTIAFCAKVEDPEDEPITWFVLFSEYGKGEDAYSMTGGGDEVKVMSFVKQCMHNFITEYQPDDIKFTADKEGSSNSRATLYARMLKRLMPSTYELVTSGGEYYTHFHLKKK